MQCYLEIIILTRPTTYHILSLVGGHLDFRGGQCKLSITPPSASPMSSMKSLKASFIIVFIVNMNDEIHVHVCKILTTTEYTHTHRGRDHESQCQRHPMFLELNWVTCNLHDEMHTLNRDITVDTYIFLPDITCWRWCLPALKTSSDVMRLEGNQK